MSKTPPDLPLVFTRFLSTLPSISLLDGGCFIDNSCVMPYILRLLFLIRRHSCKKRSLIRALNKVKRWRAQLPRSSAKRCVRISKIIHLRGKILCDTQTTYGKWILRFLNTELALHGWSATLVWEGDDHVFLLHKLSRKTSKVQEPEENSIPHLYLIFILITLFSWMFEAVFVPVVN